MRGPVEIRLLRSCQARPEVTRMLPLEKIEKEQLASPMTLTTPGRILAFWEEFGCITEEQLLGLEWIFIVKRLLRDIVNFNE